MLTLDAFTERMNSLTFPNPWHTAEGGAGCPSAGVPCVLEDRVRNTGSVLSTARSPGLHSCEYRLLIEQFVWGLSEDPRVLPFEVNTDAAHDRNCEALWPAVRHNPQSI